MAHAWLGLKIPQIRHAADLVVAQDCYETWFEGNNDIIAQDPTLKNIFQNRGVGYANEYLRHSKAANALYADGHVERLTYRDQQSYDPYTGVYNSKTIASITP